MNGNPDNFDLDQNDENIFGDEVSDEALEAAAGSNIQKCASQTGLFDPGANCTCMSGW